MRYTLALVAALTLIVLVPSTSYACSCAAASVAAYARDSDLVVRGEVTDRDETFSPFSEGDVTYEVAVDAVYVGQSAERIEVRSAGSGASCGLEVEPGREYVLFLDAQDGGWSGSLCGGTGEASPAYVGKVERVLGAASRDPERAAPEPDGWPAPYVVGGAALGGGAVAAAGAVLLLRRRRG